MIRLNWSKPRSREANEKKKIIMIEDQTTEENALTDARGVWSKSQRSLTPSLDLDHRATDWGRLHSALAWSPDVLQCWTTFYASTKPGEWSLVTRNRSVSDCFSTLGI
ncbi:hypothetical protein RRG08_032643 [Elysia crispata]|uniref:Uncharacterized protein n=1 Tax=Elysia crispata TaxID=231223 RepID=A0AAE0Y072_9GAST|nr:hypothetical protein RRG08_032643 [Elysia crispata]